MHTYILIIYCDPISPSPHTTQAYKLSFKETKLNNNDLENLNTFNELKINIEWIEHNLK